MHIYIDGCDFMLNGHRLTYMSNYFKIKHGKLNENNLLKLLLG